MKNFSLLLIAVFLLAGCNDDEESSPESKVFVTFNPRAGGEDLQLGETHTNMMDYPYSVSLMKFFISNIELITTDGTSIELSDIEIIDIGENKRTLEFTVPEGNYTGVRYDLGVPAEMNGVNDSTFSTAQYPAGHPLNEQTTQMYWQVSAGYKFFSFEGRYDIEPNDGLLPNTFLFHTGHDVLFREVGFFSKELDLSSGGNGLFEFAVDVDSIFVTSDDVVDLAFFDDFHGSMDLIDEAEKIANNMVRSFVLK
ncbi:MAG: MbnP family protein [Bacteroidota bacterium]